MFVGWTFPLSFNTGARLYLPMATFRNALLLTLLIITSIVLFKPLMALFSDIHLFRDYVRGFGMLGPLVLIILIAVQVVIAPIPGQIAGLFSGYTYGAIAGTSYSMIGLTLGSFIAFALSKKLGRPFVEKFISKHHLARFDSYIEKSGGIALFLIFLFPGLPNDAVCYIAGLTRINLLRLTIISFLGRLPGFAVLNMVGAGIARNDPFFAIIIFSSFLLVSAILFIYRARIEHALRKITKKDA